MRLNFEKFLNENGLQIGDKVRLTENNEIYEIIKDDDYDSLFLKNIKYKTVVVSIQFLKYDFEKVGHKKVGDLTCDRIGCDACPLNCLNCGCVFRDTLTTREIFEKTLNIHPQLEPMRAYFETELNKEVE